MERPEMMDDEMEKLLVKLMDNADVIQSLLEVLEKLKSAGILDLMSNLANDYLPTDVDFLGKFFSSKEFTLSLMKTLNVLTSVMGAMGSEKNSDMIKAFMYNFENVTENVQDAVNNPKRYSPMKIGKILSDEDIMLSVSALVAVLKSTGQILRKTMK